MSNDKPANWPPANWEVEMQAELERLQLSMLRCGALGAGMRAPAAERARISLVLLGLESRDDLSPACLELRQTIRRMARDAAVFAQGAVSKAIAPENDPRRG